MTPTRLRTRVGAGLLPSLIFGHIAPVTVYILPVENKTNQTACLKINIHVSLLICLQLGIFGFCSFIKEKFSLAVIIMRSPPKTTHSLFIDISLIRINNLYNYYHPSILFHACFMIYYIRLIN